MRLLIARAFCIAALFAGLSPRPDAHASNLRSSKMQAKQVCQVPIGWNDVAARKPRFVVFGEVHGTRQAPAFIGDVACALAARGERILVAVEHSATENDAALGKFAINFAPEAPAALPRSQAKNQQPARASEPGLPGNFFHAQLVRHGTAKHE